MPLPKAPITCEFHGRNALSRKKKRLTTRNRIPMLKKKWLIWSILQWDQFLPLLGFTDFKDHDLCYAAMNFLVLLSPSRVCELNSLLTTPVDDLEGSAPLTISRFKHHFFAASPPKNHCKLVRCGWKMKETFQKLCWLFWDSWIGCTSPPARWYLLELEQLSWNSESKVHFFPGGPLFIFPWTDANMELKSLANVLIQKWSHRSVEKSVAKSNTGVFFEDAAFNASTIPRHLEAGQIRCVATSK